jgi:hypothetical protein
MMEKPLSQRLKMRRFRVEELAPPLSDSFLHASGCGFEHIAAAVSVAFQLQIDFLDGCSGSGKSIGSLLVDQGSPGSFDPLHLDGTNLSKVTPLFCISTLSS